MTYSMAEGVRIAAQAAEDITHWLHSLPETISVKNVENEPAFQSRDIDLIWTTQTGEVLIEIKGDRWNKTKNFFFETHSNQEKGTPGCFMYTQADWLFYYFVNTRQLYQLPMAKTRDWFRVTIKRFKESTTTTSIGTAYYTTVGRLVPITTVMLEVSGVVMTQLEQF